MVEGWSQDPIRAKRTNVGPFNEGNKGSPYNVIMSAYWVESFNTAPTVGRLVNLAMLPINCVTLGKSLTSSAKFFDHFYAYIKRHICENMVLVVKP